MGNGTLAHPEAYTRPTRPAFARARQQ